MDTWPDCLPSCIFRPCVNRGRSFSSLSDNTTQLRYLLGRESLSLPQSAMTTTSAHPCMSQYPHCYPRLRIPPDDEPPTASAINAAGAVAVPENPFCDTRQKSSLVDAESRTLGVSLCKFPLHSRHSGASAVADSDTNPYVPCRRRAFLSYSIFWFKNFPEFYPRYYSRASRNTA